MRFTLERERCEVIDGGRLRACLIHTHGCFTGTIFTSDPRQVSNHAQIHKISSNIFFFRLIRTDKSGILHPLLILQVGGEREIGLVARLVVHFVVLSNCRFGGICSVVGKDVVVVFRKLGIAARCSVLVDLLDVARPVADRVTDSSVTEKEFVVLDLGQLQVFMPTMKGELIPRMDQVEIILEYE